jgi:predicted acyl esterase
MRASVLLPPALALPLLLLLALQQAPLPSCADTTDSAAGIAHLTRPVSHLPTRFWHSHSPDEYRDAEAKLHPVFGGFHQVLNPVFAELLSALRAKAAQQAPQVAVSHHMLRMRDGVQLSTIVINPAAGGGDRRGTLMARSPYGPTSDQIADLFTTMNGFVAVIQDQRGTFLSGGEFTMWHNDAEDGADTMDWIVKQEWSNGKVFSAGISADG